MLINAWQIVRVDKVMARCMQKPKDSIYTQLSNIADVVNSFWMHENIHIYMYIHITFLLLFSAFWVKFSVDNILIFFSYFSPKID